MKRIDEIFDISYGTKLDKNKTNEPKTNPILFVSRTSKNHGIDVICERQIGLKINPVNSISVPLGGEGRMTANVQFREYYNGQNVAILTPREDMTLNEKIYYSLIIRANQFRYSAFGREANSTLGSILIPEKSEIPQFVYDVNVAEFESGNSDSIQKPKSTIKIRLTDMFDVLHGSYISEEEAKKCEPGDICFVSSGRFNNGVKGKISLIGVETTIFPKKCLTLAKNGSVGQCFYHEENIVCTSDVMVLKHKTIELDKYLGQYFRVLIEHHIFRFNYGRKINSDRINEIILFLPWDSENNSVDYEYMRDTIKHLKFADLI